MIKHFLTRQFLKFLFVGSTAALANWVSRIILNFWTTFSLSVVIAYLVGMSVAFVLNKIFVFPGSSRSTKSQMRDFVLTNLICFPIVWVMSIQLKALLQNFGAQNYAEEIAHFIALALPMAGSFLIYKFVAFKIK
jgi:putative flippase GtrA